MHALACRSLLATGRITCARTCRRIAGRRFGLSRNFRASTYQLDSGRNDSQDATSTYPQLDNSPTTSSNVRDGQPALTQASEQPSDEVEEHSSSEGGQNAANGRIKGPYGSAKRRMKRNLARVPGAVVTSLPPHFVQHNIKLYHPLVETSNEYAEINGGNASGDSDNDIYPNATVGGGAYQVNRDVLFECHASVNAGLRPTWPGEAKSLASSRPHLVLQSPKNGGSRFLDAIVDNASQRCKADVVRLDAQDIAEFVADNQSMNPPPYTSGSLHTLGYDAHVVPPSERSRKESEDEAAEDDIWDESDLESNAAPRFGMGKSGLKGSSIIGSPVVISAVSGNLSDMLKNWGLARPSGKDSKDDASPLQTEGMQTRVSPPSDQSLVANLIESLISETTLMRQARLHQTSDLAGPAAEETASHNTDLTAQTSQPAAEQTRGIILHIKDYLELFSTAAGSSLLRSISDLIIRHRNEGKCIMLVGTTSSEDLLPAVTKEGWRDVQNESTSGPYRTIIVPCASPDADDTFKSDESLRIRQINIRHLQDMIRRLTFDPDHTENICRPGALEIQSSSIFASGMAEEVWSFEHVQRVANTCLGLIPKGEDLTADHIEWALSMITSSDDSKSNWLVKDKKRSGKSPLIGGDSKGSQEDRMKKLRKSCSVHERKLLSGVVDASSIRTTFQDVRASPGTIDALQNLTSLSLTRPEAFTYGVLASEKIPGLLLYGPPGTGKTLLARAVAKESGATVLEVSGSDVYDMYVGEGEKNVRAIFTLAKKIAPCVVFIDEADAIFGQRSNSGTRTTHREIINQFLREWDGMHEKSAFIMVATNRPFDLDDAVLRRLPRRLLVDLPTEKDREEILRIHLKDEQLDPDVSLSSISQRTPFYSGSDLKNVSVAAALACVREETDKALAYANDSLSGPLEAQSLDAGQDWQKRGAARHFQYPEKRLLKNSHFEKALSEISASISDDMSSLTAIRKFDEKYGDKRGRKKRTGGYGFGTLSEAEREKFEDGRVRQGQ